MRGIAGGSARPAGLPPRDFPENYRNYPLAGHQPSTPFWATPIGIALVVLLILFIPGLAIWL